MVFNLFLLRLLERRSHVNIMESQSGLEYQTGVRWCGSITVTLCTIIMLYIIIVFPPLWLKNF